MARHGRRDSHCEIKLATGSPTSRLAHSRYRAVVTDAHPRPQNLTWIVVNTTAEVEQEMTLRAIGKGVAMDADSFAGGQLRANLGAIQRYSIVAGFSVFACV